MVSILCLIKYMFILRRIVIWFLFIYRENDVAGIDVNMGCPKDYSVKVNRLMGLQYLYLFLLMDYFFN